MKFILGENHEHSKEFKNFLEKLGYSVEIEKDSKLLFGMNDPKIELLFKEWYEYENNKKL